jgi:3D (Asp-Asp-Asp) domain-containing protein
LEIVGVLAVSVFFWGVILLAAWAHIEKPTDVYKSVSEEEKTAVLYSQNQVEEEKEKETVCLGEFVLTAYCPCEKCCGKWARSRPLDENGNDIVIGANGDRLYQGVSIAVDPAVIPYDSKVYINGKEYIAHDCGGAIKGKRIDIYFDNHQDALDFGVQYANVEVQK